MDIDRSIDRNHGISFSTLMSQLYMAKPYIAGIGRIWIAATKSGIMHISIGGNLRKFLNGLCENDGYKEDEARFNTIIKQISDLAKGKRVRFRACLDLYGTPFQRRVWKAIAKIPWGETRSYSWLAAQAGNSKAVRAAANACGANPVPIIIPCHRVIASDGSIGGFSGGIDLKRRLLKLEGVE
ncbi:MAG: methylated-DNA--[protein]-cysteine S-methyltransferase [Pseudomonadota bacterium]